MAFVLAGAQGFELSTMWLVCVSGSWSLARKSVEPQSTHARRVFDDALLPLVDDAGDLDALMGRRRPSGSAPMTLQSSLATTLRVVVLSGVQPSPRTGRDFGDTWPHHQSAGQPGVGSLLAQRRPLWVTVREPGSLAGAWNHAACVHLPVDRPVRSPLSPGGYATGPS